MLRQNMIGVACVPFFYIGARICTAPADSGADVLYQANEASYWSRIQGNGHVEAPWVINLVQICKLPPLKSSVARLFLLWIIKCCILNYFVVPITVHVILLCFGALCVQNEVPGCAEGPGACDAFIITLKHFG